MQQALDLARQGVALASPNPCVGAVLVSPTARLLGAALTLRKSQTCRSGGHRGAGDHARGEPRYTSALEPCSHTGRTGPCTDAVIAAGVKRVVAAMRDPNPREGGRGLAKLREAGIEVQEGVLEAEAQEAE